MRVVFSRMTRNQAICELLTRARRVKTVGNVFCKLSVLGFENVE